MVSTTRSALSIVVAALALSVFTTLFSPQVYAEDSAVAAPEDDAEEGNAVTVKFVNVG